MYTFFRISSFLAFFNFDSENELFFFAETEHDQVLKCVFVRTLFLFLFHKFKQFFIECFF